MEETWYRGVRGSVEDCWFMYSRSRVGKVWLRGRWKFEPGPPRPWSRKEPRLESGEKVKGALGLMALPEKEEPPPSVKALDKEVVLWELECL